MSEWKECKLGKLIDDGNFSVGDGNYSSKYPKQSELLSTGIPFISSNDLQNGRIVPDNLRYISQEQHFLLMKGHIRTNDLIIVVRGNGVGTVALADEKFNDSNLNAQLAFVRSIKQDSRFLYFYFLNLKKQNIIERYVSGSAQPQLTIGQLFEIPILLPPIAEQKAIAGVLSALDDKIDLLHRQNKTLEAMAEALFRQWFVEEAEESWEEGKLGDLVTIVSGTTPKTENPEFWNGEYYWTSPRDITNLNGLFLFDTERKITKLGLDQIGSGLLPVGSLLMSSRAPVGALAFAEIPVAINQGYAGIICDKGYKREFIFLWLKANMDLVHSYANGSTFQEISKSAFKSLDILIPDREKMAMFHTIIDDKFERIRLNSIQIRSLEKLRDTLLPKLMSGEVRVEV
ncbi:restriction endonuclease subunit S [Leptospira jelokensis]|uniref:restriction endonuclease subunit S n=1 Tax=Leptospira jelokensis TaxID=2484931 RepID=UPI0010916967|nr:restriction endonuclease subunit S [Leptospira jelokensis]TGM05387.1 restriction endonuclease subunit S [Leptospira jelokensis]